MVLVTWVHASHVAQLDEVHACDQGGAGPARQLGSVVLQLCGQHCTALVLNLLPPVHSRQPGTSNQICQPRDMEKTLEFTDRDTSLCHRFEELVTLHWVHRKHLDVLLSRNRTRHRGGLPSVRCRITRFDHLVFTHQHADVGPCKDVLVKYNLKLALPSIKESKVMVWGSWENYYRGWDGGAAHLGSNSLSALMDSSWSEPLYCITASTSQRTTSVCCSPSGKLRYL